MNSTRISTMSKRVWANTALGRVETLVQSWATRRDTLATGQMKQGLRYPLVLRDTTPRQRPAKKLVWQTLARKLAKRLEPSSVKSMLLVGTKSAERLMDRIGARIISTWHGVEKSSRETTGFAFFVARPKTSKQTTLKSGGITRNYDTEFQMVERCAFNVTGKHPTTG